MLSFDPLLIEQQLSLLSWDGDRYIPRQLTLEEITQSRALIRSRVIIDRGGHRARSDFGRRDTLGIGFEYHELVNRARTPEGSIARWLSYQPELCALLTKQEHEEAHNHEAREKLWQVKYQQYGYKDVKYVFDLLNSYLYVPVDLKLPTPLGD